MQNFNIPACILRNVSSTRYTCIVIKYGFRDSSSSSPRPINIPSMSFRSAPHNLRLPLPRCEPPRVPDNVRARYENPPFLSTIHNQRMEHQRRKLAGDTPNLSYHPRRGPSRPLQASSHVCRWHRRQKESPTSYEHAISVRPFPRMGQDLGFRPRIRRCPALESLDLDNWRIPKNRRDQEAFLEWGQESWAATLSAHDKEVVQSASGETPKRLLDEPVREGTVRVRLRYNKRNPYCKRVSIDLGSPTNRDC